MSTHVVRVETSMYEQAKRIAALRGEQPSALLAAAWSEYFDNHRAEFAADLEKSAKLLRDGSLEDLAAWVNEDVDELAAQDAASVNC